MGLIGVFSDAHGHFEACRLAIDTLRERGAEQLVFLGDAVGYIPDRRVIPLLRDENVLCIRGNHEAMLFAGPQPANKDAIYRLGELLDTFQPGDMDFLKQWPSFRRSKVHGLDLLFVHGNPKDHTFGYVYPDTDITQFRDTEADVIFMGHTHRPFVRADSHRLFVNVGSCGLPRDGSGYASACIFDPPNCKAEIISLDISASAVAIINKGAITGPVIDLLRVCARNCETELP